MIMADLAPNVRLVGKWPIDVFKLKARTVRYCGWTIFKRSDQAFMKIGIDK